MAAACPLHAQNLGAKPAATALGRRRGARTLSAARNGALSSIVQARGEMGGTYFNEMFDGGEVRLPYAALGAWVEAMPAGCAASSRPRPRRCFDASASPLPFTATAATLIA